MVDGGVYFDGGCGVVDGCGVDVVYCYEFVGECG